MRSDHLAINMVFLNRSIQFKSKRDEQLVIDWKRIQKVSEVKVEFNVILSEKLKYMNGYTDYNTLILKSAEIMAMHKNSINQGWYHHSKDTMKPVMDVMNSILYTICSE